MKPVTHPFETLRTWLDEAHATEPRVAEAMQIASVGADGRPSLRTVLLKQITDEGLVFFTNYRSRKARELDANGVIAALLHFKGLERQVIVEGQVSRVAAEVSDAYHASRPRGSQLGAWASSQSAPCDGRAELIEAFASVESRFADGPVPRPPHWGGYTLLADTVELWVSRHARIHDRAEWRRTVDDDGGASTWQSRRLQP